MKARKTPEGFAANTKQEILEQIDKSDGRKQVISKKRKTVLWEAGGWKKKGSQNLERIAQALEYAGVYVDRDLTETEQDTFLWFALHPIRGRRPTPQFSSERALVAFIAQNHPLLFRKIPGIADLELVALEPEFMDTPIGEKPDLVFRDSEGRTVVAEVEVGDPQENSAFQVLKYMNAADAKLGVLITARPSNAELEANTREALELMKPEKPSIWLRYDVSLAQMA